MWPWLLARLLARAGATWVRHSSLAPPRQVFLESTAEICSRLEPLGFKYVRSGPRASRQSGDFRHVIWFQSSRNNHAGGLVVLWIHASVESKRLLEWRRRTGEPSTDDAFVAGGQIGNLRRRSSWMEWNLANPRTRPRKIDDAVASIEKIILPVFDLFDEPAELRDLLIQTDVPAIGIGHALDYLLCFHGHDAASLAARQYLARHPRLEKDYRRELEAMRLQGLPSSRPVAYAPCLAYMTIKHHLSIDDA